MLLLLLLCERLGLDYVDTYYVFNDDLISLSNLTNTSVPLNPNATAYYTSSYHVAVEKSIALSGSRLMNIVFLTDYEMQRGKGPYWFIDWNVSVNVECRGMEGYVSGVDNKCYVPLDQLQMLDLRQLYFDGPYAVSLTVDGFHLELKWRALNNEAPIIWVSGGHSNGYASLNVNVQNNYVNLSWFETYGIGMYKSNGYMTLSCANNTWVQPGTFVVYFDGGYNENRDMAAYFESYVLYIRMNECITVNYRCVL